LRIEANSEDLSLIGFDNHTWSALIDPPLTTVEHDGWALGVEVADRLSSVLDGEHHAPRITTLETRLVMRRSTARPPREAADDAA
jgi:LacI family transcriptional regulator